jgi:2-amino-4-hydroxy-6-hydroxymethyldihydropteridine diphosphokinase
LSLPGFMRAPVTAYVALGANLGEAGATLLWAMDALAALHGVTLTHRSSLYRTAPIESSGPDYVNAVVELSTTLTAPALLAQLQQLEQTAGRERSFRNAPRTLDLDLLLYGAAHISSPHLELPHPRMMERAFVLVPLAEIAPDKVSEVQLNAVLSQVIARLPAS